MSNIWTQFTSKFTDLQVGNKSISSYPKESQSAFVCWVLITLNNYGDHLNHILNDKDRLQTTIEVWSDGFRNCTPKQVVNTLHAFCDGKAHLSGRFECNMPKSICEFVHEMGTNRHQSASYDAAPIGCLLDYDKETARQRSEKVNEACMRFVKNTLPTLPGLLEKRKRHVEALEEKGGERLALHKRRIEGYNEQIRQHGHVVSEMY